MSRSWMTGVASMSKVVDDWGYLNVKVVNDWGYLNDEGRG